MPENKETTSEVKTWEEALEQESWIAPFINIYETTDDFILTASMPGVIKDNVKTKLEDGNLVIMGKVDFEKLNSHKYILKEIETSHYFRKFKISDSIDASKIEGNFENGQLILTLPKHERVKPKTIMID